jgi:hypothetical protein
MLGLLRFPPGYRGFISGASRVKLFSFKEAQVLMNYGFILIILYG